MTELLTSDQIWTKQLVVHKHPVRPPFGKAHRSPKRGYDTPVKAQWRTSVWENLIRHLPPGVRGNSSAFIVDTTDALEIDKALSLGFTEEHLHVCNVNPAIVATLKRR